MGHSHAAVNAQVRLMSYLFMASVQRQLLLIARAAAKLRGVGRFYIVVAAVAVANLRTVL